jgi:hypothetical protein
LIINFETEFNLPWIQDLAEREDALRERVDEIERLTRAVDVLKHAREVDRRAANLQSKK